MQNVLHRCGVSNKRPVSVAGCVLGGVRGEVGCDWASELTRLLSWQPALFCDCERKTAT